MALDPDRFWQAACELYARPGVSKICLKLQDGPYAFNVNVLIVAVDFERQKRTLRPLDFAQIERSIETWQTEILKPLRAIRRQSKNRDSNTYEALKKAELQAERAEQALILQTIGDLHLDPDIPEPMANLDAYARHRGASEDLEARAKLTKLLGSVRP